MSDLFSKEVLALVPKLRGYATMLLGSAADADDLVQDVLVRAWRYRQTFRSGTNLKAWLFRILRNEFLSQARRTPRRVSSLDSDDWLMPITLPDQEWRREYQEVLVALQKLPDPNREALLLVTASGLSYEEAAETCNCSIGTIKSRVSRARDRLCELLDREEPVKRMAPASPNAFAFA